MIHGNGNFASKAAFKRHVKACETLLEAYFIDPSMFAQSTMCNLEGVAVVGPEAYDRKWWAQVWTDENGIVTKVT